MGGIVSRVSTACSAPSQSRTADASFVHDLDRVTREVVAELGPAMANAVPGDQIAVPGAGVRVNVVRRVTVAELRRLRQQFLRLASARPPVSAEGGRTQFIEFLNNEILRGQREQ